MIYALGGLLCGVGYGVSLFLTETFMKMGGMDVQMPPILKVGGIVTSFLMLVLGILMLSGAISLIRRRRSGVKLLKAWAILRVLLTVLSVAFGVLAAPAQLEFQRSMAEATNQKLIEAKHPTQPIPSDEALWRRLVITTAVMSAVMSAYPVFLGFYLSRRKVAMEVEGWR
jgi:hypothetical protein